MSVILSTYLPAWSVNTWTCLGYMGLKVVFEALCYPWTAIHSNIVGLGWTVGHTHGGRVGPGVAFFVQLLLVRIGGLGFFGGLQKRV